MSSQPSAAGRPRPTVRPAELDEARCAVCDRAAPLVQPPCPDGHGSECPDRICADCGAAVFLDPVVVASRVVA